MRIALSSMLSFCHVHQLWTAIVGLDYFTKALYDMEASVQLITATTRPLFIDFIEIQTKQTSLSINHT